MKYGRITDGVLTYAPKTITEEGRVHYHPSEEMYKRYGYLPILETSYPETDEDNPKYYAESWEERCGLIVKVYTETEAPMPESPEPKAETSINELESRVASLEAVIFEPVKRM